MKSDEKMTRRTFLKKSNLLIGSLLAAPIAGYGYSRLLEPKWLEVVYKTLVLQRLPSHFKDKRILLFSDVHLDYHFGIDRMENLVDNIRRLQPDMLIFTGDLYDSTIGSTEADCIHLLQRLEAPLGKWAVLGNHDYITDAIEVGRILTKGGFHVLTNQHAVVELEGQRIQVAGIDDMFHGTPDLKAALKKSDPHLFTILLAHEPDLADKTLSYAVDLQLSGHSHGGQVRVPVIGPLILPELAKKYPHGLYSLGEGKLLLYTNRGIGLSTHPIRFLCRPEITVLTLTT